MRGGGSLLQKQTTVMGKKERGPFTGRARMFGAWDGGKGLYGRRLER